MRYYIISALVIALGSAVAFTGVPNSQFAPEESTSEVELERYTLATKGLKVQQAKLRRVRTSDLAEVPSMRPVPEGIHISSPFGMRLHPVYKKKRMHYGIDFPAPIGTAVYATAGGVVLETVTRADSSTYGKHIVIGHDDVHRSLYAHLSKVFVRKGMEVEKGDTIGLTGNTGVSTNPHLHYEIFKHDMHKNPQRYLSEKN